jgi:DHA1 family inner membrane transport protein
MPRKTVLVVLMMIFTIGNIICALAPTYGILMSARIITSLAHGTFFGVGSVVATGLVAPDRKASAISIMFTGLTLATLLGVPAGAWLGLHLGWRATFWAVAAIGVLATLVIVMLVPTDKNPTEASAFSDEMQAIRRAPVLLGLLTTVLGFAGVFVVFSYIQPLLTQLTGFSVHAVSPILLIFGVGLVAGNYLGGRLADRSVMSTLIGTLATLAIVLAAMTFALPSKSAVIVFTGLLGMAAFATVAPLQLRVLQEAGARQTLASSLNIAAFNLGNAIGAWLGGVVIDRGPGLGALPWVAALVTCSGLLVALCSARLARRRGETDDAAGRVHAH